MFDCFEVMFCACGYVEDVTLSEFVYVIYVGIFVVMRFFMGFGVNEVVVLCGYLSEFMFCILVLV